jgi:hypothetical protein
LGEGRRVGRADLSKHPFIDRHPFASHTDGLATD